MITELLLSIQTIFEQHMWLICLVIAGILLATLLLLFIQWKRVKHKKKYPKKIDRTVEARDSIEHARQMIENGLVKGLRAEFGDVIPADAALMQEYLSVAYAIRIGGQYISVDALSAFVHSVPHIFLQGSDSVGGCAVLPLKMSETGERCVYLEGLSVCYRSDGFSATVKYNIRFLCAKAGRPIEEVIDFEIA